MKRFFLRMSALATVVVLGWIAIAHAQRQNDEPEPARTPTSSAQTPQLLTASQTSRANPLRTEDRPPTPIKTQPVAVRQTAHNETPAASSAPPSSPPDLFGLQSAGATTSGAGEAQAGASALAEPGTLAVGGPERPLSPDVPELAAPTAPPAASTPTSSESPLRTGLPASRSAPASGSSNVSSAEPPAFAPGTTVSSGAAASRNAPIAFPASRGIPSENPAIAAAANAFDAVPSSAAASSEGTGQPASDKQLDGPQSPQLSIQKFAPAEIQVGKPAVFRVEVKNTGRVAAQGVEIRDQVPKGTQLLETNPKASIGARGELVWTLGKVEPGAAVSVEAKLMPVAEGEIGSVATVHFAAAASVRTVATKPQLVVETTGPKQVMIDDAMTLVITVSNPGTGVATGVVIEEHVPPGMQHPAGAELEYQVGELRPGQSQTLELKLTAARAGAMSNVLIARADGLAQVQKEMPLEVVAPELKLAMSGPKNRYLERQATYELTVSNPGSAPARDVRLVAQLPNGLKFVNANNNGHYDETTRTVHWALAELPVNETGTVQLTTLPVAIGQQTVCFRGTAERALTVEQEQQVSIDGIAAIRFQVVDVDDPIEIGGETTYEVHVLNQGSKDATNVRVTVTLPAGLQPIAAEGPGSLRHALEGNQIAFEPLARLSPKVDATYRVRVQGREAGDHRIRVQLQTDELQSPVTKEESTRVFSDK
jgi:uncharacterized repeat protein (TIGR01451 family)